MNSFQTSVLLLMNDLFYSKKNTKMSNCFNGVDNQIDITKDWFEQ